MNSTVLSSESRVENNAPELTPADAGYVVELTPRVFGVQRLTNSRYGRDLIEAALPDEEGYFNSEIEISSASFRGSIADAREMAAAILQACDLAEGRLNNTNAS